MSKARNNVKKTNDIIDVVADYGADKSGVADATTAIQSAIDGNPGKTILLPAGSYKVTGSLTVSADNTTVTGVGQATRVLQYTPDTDTFKIKPTTAGTTSAFLNSPALRNLFVSHTPVAASSTQGAAVRVTQCNAWRVTGVYTADADIFVEGGQDGSIGDIGGYAVNGSYRGADSAMLHFVQAAYGASYQPMYTTKVGAINLSGGGKRDTVIRIANCDGLQFSTGYLNNGGGNSLVKIKAERDNSYVAALNLGSLYLDGVGGCLNGIDAPADGYANSFIYHLVLPRTVNIGGFAERGIKVRKDIQSFNNDAEIINCTLWGVDFEGDSTNSVLKFSPTTSTNGDATTGDIRIGGSGKSLSLTGWKTKGAENLALLLAAGTWGRGVIANCVNDTNIADISNLATFTDGKPGFEGCVSAYTGAAANSWRGLNQLTAKATPVDADVLSVWDSAASWIRKSLTIANLAAALLNGRAIGATSQSTGKFTTLQTTSTVGIGTAPSQHAIDIQKTLTGNVSTSGVSVASTIQSDVTTNGQGYGTFLSTQATAFTLTNLAHFKAQQGTIGAGSTVTLQYGFFAQSSLTGATTNYGFYGDIASGANRWNYYANGTAANYFNGNTTFGTKYGYGTLTGAGGAVTQATSKATGVTLNTAVGQITMNNAALAATTKVSFTLTSSSIGVHDEVYVWRKSGGTAGSYSVWVDSVAAGSCVITLENYSAGSLSEAVVLGFAVKSGVIA